MLVTNCRLAAGGAVEFRHAHPGELNIEKSPYLFNEILFEK